MWNPLKQVLCSSRAAPPPDYGQEPLFIQHSIATVSHLTLVSCLTSLDNFVISPGACGEFFTKNQEIRKTVTIK